MFIDIFISQLLFFFNIFVKKKRNYLKLKQKNPRSALYKQQTGVGIFNGNQFL